ncbi:hypothetical protein KKG41_07150, partial [Patescibacteria group bacterium]|nr:hypothetical protein [Patescibacteria group bacterium]
MKYVILTLLGAMLVCATALAQGGSITVSHVDGAWDSGGDWYIYPDCGHGSGVTFHIHYTNNSGGYVTGMANGFA